MLPHRTNAASYSDKFVTRYLAFGISWRRLSLNLHDIGLRHELRTTHLSYGPPTRRAAPPGSRRDTSRSHIARATTRPYNNPTVYSCTKANPTAIAYDPVPGGRSGKCGAWRVTRRKFLNGRSYSLSEHSSSRYNLQ